MKNQFIKVNFLGEGDVKLLNVNAIIYVTPTDSSTVVTTVNGDKTLTESYKDFCARLTSAGVEIIERK